MAGRIRCGIGGWTFPPWRGTFYPEGLPQKDELAFASRALSTIEINGTFYSTFKPASWRKWRDETPDDFVFAVKASRYATNRKVLAEAGPAIARFLGQGLSELGAKLGPINWQFAATKKFDAADFGAFLALLPDTVDGVRLRHALEVKHPSFAASGEFAAMVERRGMAVVHEYGEDAAPPSAASFTYARFTATREDEANGMNTREIAAIASDVKAWARHGDVFAYFIGGAKERNPAAAQALMRKTGGAKLAP